MACNSPYVSAAQSFLIKVSCINSRAAYCFGLMELKVIAIPAKAGIHCRRAIAVGTPAFTGVTSSNIIVPHHSYVTTEILYVLQSQPTIGLRSIVVAR